VRKNRRKAYRKKKPQDENIMSVSATQGGHKEKEDKNYWAKI